MKISQTVAPYGCIIQFIQHHTNISFLAVYSQNGLVMNACERGNFVEIKVYERSTFSVKMVYKRVRGWNRAEPPIKL